MRKFQQSMKQITRVDLLILVSTLGLAILGACVTYVIARSVVLAVAVGLVGAGASIFGSRARAAQRRLLARTDGRTKEIYQALRDLNVAVARPEVVPEPPVPTLAAERAKPSRPDKAATRIPAIPRQRRQHEPISPPGPGAAAWAAERAITDRTSSIEGARAMYRSSARETFQVRVAAICDEFTYNSLRPDCDLVALHPKTWREQFEKHRPEVFFCESAWAGVPSSERPWRGQVYASINFPYENRGTLLEVLRYCKEQGIPTVFWNKEDPTHFADRINDFVATAAKFDHIFTTAQECVPEYKALLKRGNVDTLPFAAQPRIFHPDPSAARRGGVVFAGAWYSIHSERAKAMATLFDAAIGAGLDLDIYDRDHGTDDPTRTYPSKYSPYLRPSISHTRTAETYRTHDLGININTVTSSATMCARRVFELASSGTAILSNEAPAMQTYFGADYLTAEDLKTTNAESVLERAREMAGRNLTRVLQDHTYASRLESVFQAVGISAVPAASRVSRAVRVRTLEGARLASEAFRHGRGAYESLLLVVDHRVPSHLVGQFYTDFGRGGVRVVSQRLVQQGFVDPASLTTTLSTFLVDEEDAGVDDWLIAQRLALHAQYSRLPLRLGDSETPRLASVTSPWRTMQSAEDFHAAVASSDTIRPVLEIPNDHP